MAFSIGLIIAARTAKAYFLSPSWWMTQTAKPMKHALDWLHTGGDDQHSDLVKAELEKGFGRLTSRIGSTLPTRRKRRGSYRRVSIVSILGARIPFINIVSGNGSVDTTFGVGFEAGIPVNSSVSKNAEVVPKIFNDLRLGDHFTLQSDLWLFDTIWRRPRSHVADVRIRIRFRLYDPA